MANATPDQASPMRSRDTRGTGGRHWGMALALIGAGLFVRVWAAWCLRHTTHPDFGIMALMARHIATGSDWPVFYYGQSYMGSLETVPSALFMRCFGFTPFMGCLGTVLIATLLLPVLYVWVRDAWSPRAARAALAVSVIGPWGAVLYLSCPRGGYATLLVLGTLALWLAGRLAGRGARGEPIPAREEWGLGLTLGLGWWTHQIVLAHIVAAGVVLLLGLRRQIWRPQRLRIAAGAMIGAAPWLWWNATHGWQSLEMGGTLGQIACKEGFILLFDLFKELLVPDHLPAWAKNFVVSLFGLAGAIALSGFVTAWRRADRQRDARQHLCGAGVLVAVSIGLSVTSHFMRMQAVRYILHLFPVVALVVGILTDRLAAWRPTRRLAWLPAIALILLQLDSFRILGRMARKDIPLWTAQAELQRLANEQDLDVFIGDYGFHWMNFASGEGICVADLARERYAPYAWRANRAQRPALIGNYYGMVEFLNATRGTAQVTRIRDMPIMHSWQPPDAPGRRIVAAAALTENAVTRTTALDLADDNLATGFESTADPVTLEWTFDMPCAVSGLRLLSRENRYPRRISVSARDSEADTWREVAPVQKPTVWFWSGPRPFFGGMHYVMDLRFPTTTAQAIRIYLRPHEGVSLSLDEVWLLEPGNRAARPLADATAALRALATHLATDGVGQLYAPRWVSEQIAGVSSGRLQARLPAAAHPNSVKREGPALMPFVMPVTESDLTRTAFVVWREDADRSRAVFQRAGWACAQTNVADWAVFRTGAAGAVPLSWSEPGPFLDASPVCR